MGADVNIDVSLKSYLLFPYKKQWVMTLILTYL